MTWRATLLDACLQVFKVSCCTRFRHGLGWCARSMLCGSGSGVADTDAPRTEGVGVIESECALCEMVWLLSDFRLLRRPRVESVSSLHPVERCSAGLVTTHRAVNPNFVSFERRRPWRSD